MFRNVYHCAVNLHSEPAACVVAIIAQRHPTHSRRTVCIAAGQRLEPIPLTGYCHPYLSKRDDLCYHENVTLRVVPPLSFVFIVAPDSHQTNIYPVGGFPDGALFRSICKTSCVMRMIR